MILETNLESTRPWAFTGSELTAGLRSYTNDASLVVRSVQELNISHRRPAVGRIRGLRVDCQTNTGEKTFRLVLKEPQGTTRTGTAGAGRREVSFYRNMIDQLPIRIPKLVTAEPSGEWLALDMLDDILVPEKWSTEHYLQAIDQLVVLHDRFWNLGEDLHAYTWLARPLDSDFNIHLQAATNSIERLREGEPENPISQDADFMDSMDRLLRHSGKIATALSSAPSTILHGDYWPGNIYVTSDNELIVFDWQKAGIGPGVLDLLNFVQMSQWWFEPLSFSPEILIHRYREGIARFTGFTWEDEAWRSLWEHALLWVFLTEWVDVLATSPKSLVETRYAQLESLWLRPIGEAILNQLPEE